MRIAEEKASAKAASAAKAEADKKKKEAERKRLLALTQRWVIPFHGYTLDLRLRLAVGQDAPGAGPGRADWHPGYSRCRRARLSSPAGPTRAMAT